MSQLEIINTLLNDVPEKQLSTIIDFLLFLKLRNDDTALQDIAAASVSSMDFWDNPDDEVWDYV